MKSSHILCKVEDLARAVEGFTALGFTVEWGNDPAVAENAIIWFEEGPFIELIDAEKVKQPFDVDWMRRFDLWCEQNEGFCEFALESHEPDITPDLRAFRKSGIEIAGPIQSQTHPPGREVVPALTAFPHDPRLPILMQAFDPDPRLENVRHANGAKSVARVVIGVAEACAEEWRALMDEDEPLIEIRHDCEGVRSVSLHGLESDIAPEKAHGAVLLAAH